MLSSSAGPIYCSEMPDSTNQTNILGSNFCFDLYFTFDGVFFMSEK